MKGFILANGHSGTTWAAEALTHCTDLVAKHESWRHKIGPDFGGVESNGNLWNRCEELEALFPGVPRIHLVRDGRLVVRTIMYRTGPSFFEGACRRWNNRNERLMVEICRANRYRLEDLTTRWKTFQAMAQRLGATRVDRKKWERVRGVRVNPSAKALQGRFPPPEEWAAGERDTFWSICGQTMKELGYRSLYPTELP